MELEKASNPLSDRYCSNEMNSLFSSVHTARVWRKLWIALAESEKEAGLSISQAQIDEMHRFKDDINFDSIKAHEKKTRHDVMSHVLAYGEQAVLAKPILHLGATSNFIKDNADLIIFKQALDLVGKKLLVVIEQLSRFSDTHKETPTLGWTHLQPAQLTTVGKRAALWLHDFVYDFERLCTVVSGLKLRGVKGTTGTQASFLDLLDGDYKKVIQLEKSLASKFGFDDVYSLTGQTYSRKVDYEILSFLSQIAQSASKLCTDMRLLASRKELEEPFEAGQIGSSAMAYKRNPMRSERVCGIARYVISLPLNASMTSSTQWLERTLDDSSNRRISMSQAFLATDSILNLLIDITSDIVVYPKMIAKNISAELPFMATENILMKAVKLGGDRQLLHESIRQHSMIVSTNIKEHGLENDLISRLKSDPLFEQINFEQIIDPSKYTGLASKQVTNYISTIVEPLLNKFEKWYRGVAVHRVSV